jgi:hypothetical protein
MPDRDLRWEGCCNIRDLGGLPLEDGGSTQFRVVVRADNIGELSPSGWDAFAAYGVGRIVDLRHEDEPYDPPVEVANVPLLDVESILELNQLLAGIDDPVEWRRRNYLHVLDRFPGRFARAVSAVAAVDGIVLVHCAGGVDRTGLVAALILRDVGVPVDVVAEDYAESEANWAPSLDGWIDNAPDHAERRMRRLLSVMPAQVMHDVLVQLEREHGSAREYLLGAGVEEDALESLRTRLRG